MGRMLAHAPLCQCEPVQEGSRKAIIAAFLANLGIAISKFIGFLITGSASLLAEAIHSVADTGNQALLILGGARAKRGRDTTSSVRLRTGAVLLGVRRRGRALHRRRRVRAVRGHREAAAPARGRELRRRDRDPPCRDRAGVVVVSHGGARGEQGARWHRMVELHPTFEGTRAAGRAARGSRCPHRPLHRPHRRDGRPLHRQRPLGRHGQRRDRRAAHRRSRSSSPSR